MDRTRLDPALPETRTASDSQPEPRSVGEYRLLRRLGEGGMGAVYLGYHEGQDRQVAIKILPDQLAGNQAYVDRFYREARHAAGLNHPNIVRGLSVGLDKASGRHYLVLEYVDGPSALALLQQYGRLSVGDAVHIALDVARALEHAHSRNVVHRDIKPDNILITRSGIAKLADLGLAKRMDEASHLTATRQGFGTPHYMPYEQALNAKYADARSDIYALGGTLYHLVTGLVPFPGENHLEVMDSKNRGQFAAAGSINPEVPPALDRILGKMLAREPRDRYQTASELIVDLERSRLAALVPSFADADLALQDPWVRACLAASAQPTMPDLNAAPRNDEQQAQPPPNASEAVAGDKTNGSAPPPANGNGVGPACRPFVLDEEWFLRYRDRKGGWARARATTRQIQLRLRTGRIPPQVEASRQADGDYQPLASFPEFRDIPASPARRRRKNGRASEETQPAGPAAAPTQGSGLLSLSPAGRWWLWLVVLPLLVSLLLVGGYYLLGWLWLMRG
jgi:serine/threonine-protein kinase